MTRKASIREADIAAAVELARSHLALLEPGQVTQQNSQTDRWIKAKPPHLRPDSNGTKFLGDAP